MARIQKMVVALAAVMLMGISSHAYAFNTKLPSDWSGPYIGAFAAYSWVDLKYYEPDFPGFDRKTNINGLTGGPLLGYNHLFDSILLGVEADAGWGNLSEGADGSSLKNNYSAFDINWNAHARARLGFLSGSTLLYVAGGLALAGVTVDDVDPNWGKADATHVGWTVGAGIEHAIAKNLRARVEYLYDDYGSKDYSISGNYTYTSNVDLTANIIRVGLYYQF
ncbi:MAG: porin family protein [Deltaproteobacteria bacterium]|nr:porin family protein [Deltaproteobacteria bacterium]